MSTQWEEEVHSLSQYPQNKQDGVGDGRGKKEKETNQINKITE